MTRRLRQTLTGTAGSSYDPFAMSGVIGYDWINDNGGSQIGTASSNIDTRSNGAIQTATTFCGDVTPGAGKTVSLSPASTSCGGVAHTGTALAPLTAVTVPTSNDNASPISSGSLTVNSAQTVTLTGHTYVLCSLQVNGTLRLMPSTNTSTPVRIYFDTCGGGAQFTVNGGGVIQGLTNPLPQLYMAGAANVQVNSGSALGVIYAPAASITINGGTTFYGALAAKTLTLNGAIQNNPGTQGPIDVSGSGGGGSATYGTGAVVECTSSGASNSISGC